MNDSPGLKGLRDELLVDLSGFLNKVAALKRCCVNNTAKLQILRDSFREIDWEHACCERPEMREWFDKDGVPK